MIQNQRGSITPYALLLMLFLSALLFSNLYRILRDHHDIRERARTYLCYKHLVLAYKKHLPIINRQNKLVYRAFLLKEASKSVPKLNVITYAAWMATSTAQIGNIQRFSRELQIAKKKKFTGLALCSQRHFDSYVSSLLLNQGELASATSGLSGPLGGILSKIPLLGQLIGQVPYKPDLTTGEWKYMRERWSFSVKSKKFFVIAKWRGFGHKNPSFDYSGREGLF